MQEVLLFATILVPIVLALVEVVKRTVSVEARYVTLISLVVGILVGVVSAQFTTLDISARIWAGAFAGLSSSGLYDVIKPTGGTDKNK